MIGNSGGYKDRTPKKKPMIDYAANVKTNYAKLPETSDPDEIRKQVEFYFSDSNLSYDNYMNSLLEGSENKPVPIKTIHSFKRMRRFQPYSALLEAMKESTVLDVVNGDELKRKIPWKAPDVKNEFNDPSIPRSIYAKGFGDEDASTQFDIENFFAIYGPIAGVRLRRTDAREFKGSVFVEFDTLELQQQFLELEEKPKWKGQELTYKSKEDYVKGKQADIDAGILEPRNKHNYR